MVVKIGLIGCGGIAELHIAGYLKMPEHALITAVCDVVSEHAQARAQQAGGARIKIYKDYHAMLAQADIDAVDICLPHHLHKAAIVAAANAHKHILCEKPLCLTIEEAHEVQQAVTINHVTLMCAHNQLMLPAVSRARQLLDEGVVGKVYAIRTTDCFYNRFNLNTIGWRANRAYSGGGELIDTGYHPTYLLLYLANSEPAEVTAMLSRHRLEFIDGEDSAQVLVRFADGTIGNIVTSWAYEAPASSEKFSVSGEKGSLYSNGKDLFIQLRGMQRQHIELPEVNTFHEEIAHFVTCLEKGQRPLNTEREGVNVLKIILGAYASAQQKRMISLADM